MATREIAVTTVQKALKVWKHNGPDMTALDPGAVDGRWGPRTYDALRAYVAYTAPQWGFDAPRVLAPPREPALRDVPPGSSRIRLEARFATSLDELARSYDPMVRRQRREEAAASETSLPAVRRQSKAPIVIGLLLGAGVIGGAVWYFTQD
jgi:hypothetical protein